MRNQIDRFRPFLGDPDPADRFEAVREIGRSLGVDLPEDLVCVLAAYGDREYAEHIVLFGVHMLPRENDDASDSLSLAIGETEPRPRVPHADGLFVWGGSTDSDVYAVRSRGDGRWTVSAYDGENHEWTDFDAGFSDWLHAALVRDPGFELFPIYEQSTPYAAIEIQA